MQSKRWNITPPSPETADLAERLRTSPLIAQALLNRGLREPTECHDFLRPTLKNLLEPKGIYGLTKAAERIAHAIREKQKIVIYGDYDVDGITATTILWHTFRGLGAEVDYYIPHRIEEGYGLNSEAVAKLCDDGFQLIITVDCGITAVEAAKVARERGVDLIITDHHEWREKHTDAETRPALSAVEEGRGDAGTSRNEENSEADSLSASPHPPSTALAAGRDPASSLDLPDCAAIVHPRLDGNYANPALCGAGVALKLAWGVGQAISGENKVGKEFREFLVDAVALAALGTIADVVPLTGENRLIAHQGLCGLRQSRLVGVKALIASAGLAGQELDSFHVGFLLAPRLNAAGRMGHAAMAVEMLTKADAAKAQEIADYLETQNRERQATEKQIVEQAIEQVISRGWDQEDCRALVVGQEGWHPGVIGIVASRLVDRFHRPAIVIALTNGHGAGSARSIAGFHLAHALQECTSMLETHGGHEMAAGLKLQTDRLDEFREAFCAVAKRKLTAEMLVGALSIDAVAELRQITPALATDLCRLGPFGHGNRRPLFAALGVSIVSTRRCGGSGDHLQIQVRQGSTVLRGIAFRQGDWADRLQVGDTVDLAFEPELNEYQGRVSAQLHVKEIRLSEA